MKNHTPRGWASAAQFSAHDLVQRTLAQHGLAVNPVVEALGKAPDQHRPKNLVKDILARLRPNAGETAPQSPQPGNANFFEDQFTCVAGSRQYMIYLPQSAPKVPSGLIVMLHGCTQNPRDFAAGTQMNELAEQHGFIVVYPHQSRGENAQSCWNWFRRGDQRRDMGEPAILAGLAQTVAAKHGIPETKIYAAGLSAGAAMAVILGETYPDVFAAIGAHSGLPAGSAKDVPSAFAAMAGNGVRASTGSGAGVRSIVLHGTADATVHPGNSQQIVQRLLDQGPRQTIQTEERGQARGRGYCRTVTIDSTGAALVEHWEVEGLGHAWSGGSACGSYTDAQGPDASAEMVRFFLGKTRSAVCDKP